MERLQKVIAQAGIASRRKAEALIVSGKVKVNGQVVTELGTKVSHDDDIQVNGRHLTRENKVIFVFYKPKQVVCTAKDELDRQTVLDFFDEPYRLFPVGRLDYDTSGLLFVTNDGDFTYQMTHPKFEVPKTYLVNLDGILSKQDIQQIEQGVAGFKAAQVSLVETDQQRGRQRLLLTITEGQNHEVKRMMEALGHQVRRLHRSQFGPITCEGLNPGQYRRLKIHEYKQLMRYVKP